MASVTPALPPQPSYVNNNDDSDCDASEGESFEADEAQIALIALHRNHLEEDAARAYDEDDAFEEDEEMEEESDGVEGQRQQGKIRTDASAGATAVKLPPAAKVGGAAKGRATASAKKPPLPSSTALLQVVPTISGGNTAPGTLPPRKAGGLPSGRTTTSNITTKLPPNCTASKACGETSPRTNAKPTTLVKSTVVSGEPKRRRKRKEPRKKILNCCLSKYNLIRTLANEFGFVQEDDVELEKMTFNLIWADTVLPLQKLTRIQNWQRFNHFPSMYLLCRKGHLSITLGRMRRAFPEDFSFFPKTWALRSERSHFMRYLQQPGNARKIYIMKPNAGCQGKGILLTRDPLNAVEEVENFIVQEYMAKPLLIEGKKFDLRVYVLVTSVRHLSVMVYNDGLVRICAEQYSKPTDANLSKQCMHLTNYAVNKHSDQFVFNSDEANSSVGNKRDFRFLNDWMRSEGHDPDLFWSRVDDVVVKTIIAALPKLQHMYSSVFPHSNDGYTCFEVLGFDILVDEKLQPWLMEVNHTPSFQTDTPLDFRIKHGVLEEVWRIINVSPNDRIRHMNREKALRMRRLDCMTNQATGAASSTSIEVDPNGGPVVDTTNMGFFDEDLPSQVFASEEHRRKNFRRAYPPPNAALMAKYTSLIRGAREENQEKLTAAQEARQQELRAERDKRDARLEAERMLDPALRAASSNALAVPPDSGGVSAVVSASSATTTSDPCFAVGAKNWVMGLRGAPNMGSGSCPPSSAASPTASSPPAVASVAGLASSTATADEPARVRHGILSTARRSRPSLEAMNHSSSAPPGRHGTPPATTESPTAPSTPPSHSGGGAAIRNHGTTTTAGSAACNYKLSAESATATTTTPPISGGTSAATMAKETAAAAKLDPKVLRERLHQQMEKHRRRMVLGPRLSVFQLRDTQLEAMLQHPPQQQPIDFSLVDSASSAGIAYSLHPRGPSPPTMSPGAAQPQGGNSGEVIASVPVPRPGMSSARPQHRLNPAVFHARAHHPPHVDVAAANQPHDHGSSAYVHGLTGPTAGGGGPGVVAVSAAALQNHWLYHYDH